MSGSSSATRIVRFTPSVSAWAKPCLRLATVLDDRVRAVLARLEEEDAAERAAGLPPAERSRAVERTTGRFLFSLVAPQADCEAIRLPR